MFEENTVLNSHPNFFKLKGALYVFEALLTVGLISQHDLDQYTCNKIKQLANYLASVEAIELFPSLGVRIRCLGLLYQRLKVIGMNV